MSALTRPEPTEYESYYATYVDKVPEGPILDLLETQLVATLDLLAQIGEEGASFRYAPGKWSVKQVVGHMCDTERIFSMRALCMARREPAELFAMDQDLYVDNGGFDDRSLADLGREFESIRRSSLPLFGSFDEEALMATGTASGFSFTVRSFPYIVAGHELHHVEILKRLYLAALQS